MGNDIHIGTMQPQSLAEAERASVLREAQFDADRNTPAPPASGITRTFSLSRTVDGATESYALTITNVPADWTDAQTAQFLDLVERLNRYADTPMTDIVIGPHQRTQANIGIGRITINTRDAGDVTKCLGSVAHEMGHWIARGGAHFQKFSGDPQLQALRGLMRFHPQAKEIVDDSNFSPIAEGYGHPEQEGFDGSATFTAIRADQLRHYLERSDTPQFVREYGTAVYLAMRATFFRGEDFNSDGAAIAVGAPPMATLMASLFKYADAALPERLRTAIAGGADNITDAMDLAADLRLMAAAHPADAATIAPLATHAVTLLLQGNDLAADIITNLVGKSSDPDSEEEAALASCSVPRAWRDQVTTELQSRLTTTDLTLEHRTTLLHLLLQTAPQEAAQQLTTAVASCPDAEVSTLRNHLENLAGFKSHDVLTPLIDQLKAREAVLPQTK